MLYVVALMFFVLSVPPTVSPPPGANVSVFTESGVTIPSLARVAYERVVPVTRTIGVPDMFYTQGIYFFFLERC